MSFFEKDPKKEFKTFDKINYLGTEQGKYTVRILQDKAYKYYQHWIGGGIECLVENCPQCELNKQILAEVGYDFTKAKDVKGFASRQERGAVNVLDLTVVKTCPKCGHDNVAPRGTNFPSVCTKCGVVITEVTASPSNKVKLFSRAASVFEQVADINLQDEKGEPIPVTDFNIEIRVVGNQSVVSDTDDFTPVSVPEDALYDLSRSAIKLSREEMLQKMRGVSLKDIFAMRKSQTVAEETISEEEKEKALADLENLFK